MTLRVENSETGDGFFTEGRDDVRLRQDDGVSLVETMIGLLILSVAMLALLGTLLTSAYALVEQEQRTTATRIGTELLEAARAAGFHSPELNITTPSWVSVASPDADFTVRKRVEWQDAEASGGGGQDLKLLTYEVSWNARGTPRSVRFSSAFAPTETAFIEVSATPSSAEVDDDNHPSRDLDGNLVTQVAFRARPVGFTHPTSSPMALTWLDDSGVTQTRTMAYDAGAGEWTVAVPSSQITAVFGSADPMNPAHAFALLEFQATAGTRSATAALGLVDPDALAIMVDPAVHPTSSTADPPVTEPVEVSCVATCVTTSETTLRVTVLEFGEDAAVDEVVAAFRDGSGALVQTAGFSVDPDTSEWSLVLPAGTSMEQGTDRPFTFTARYVDTSLGEIAQTVAVDVVSVTPPVFEPPAMSGAQVVDAPVNVGFCTSSSTCRNRDAERFQVDVDPGDATVSSVVVEYTRFDGTTGAIPLTASGTRWSATVPADTRDFDPGSAQAFRFVATHDLGDPVSAQVTADVVVSTPPSMGAPSVSPVPLRVAKCSGPSPDCRNQRAQTFSVDVAPNGGTVSSAWVLYLDKSGTQQRIDLVRGSGNRWEAVVGVGARTFQPGIGRAFTFRADAGEAGTLERQVAVDVLHARAEVKPNPIDLGITSGGCTDPPMCRATQDVRFELHTDSGALFGTVSGVSVRFTVWEVNSTPAGCTRSGTTLTCELGPNPAHWDVVVPKNAVKWNPNSSQTVEYTVRLASGGTFVEQLTLGVGN